ncbi:MAG: HIT family hydrolase [Proteobacteria bacterium]|nr:MAG: HIT family hydrolase [Pseudomonadota bacterium]
MDYMYAPWRKKYFSSKSSHCVFCEIIKDKSKDEQNLVLFRDTHCFGVMNLYPYSPGHFMIIPLKHKACIADLDAKTWHQMSLHVRSGVKLLKEHFGASGVNIGMNLGNAAGAGIAEHVHYHLVPRNPKDTNFITTIAKTRVNGIDFKEIYEDIKSAIPKYLEKK